MSFALVRDDTGLVLGAVAVARDVTDRFKAERDARKRLAELEARVNSIAG
jgi:signal transduction histidine kinase